MFLKYLSICLFACYLLIGICYNSILDALILIVLKHKKRKILGKRKKA